MNCREFEQALGEGRMPESSPEARSHVRGCASCRSLAERWDEPGNELTLPPDRLHAVENSLLADLRPVRPLAPAWVFLLAMTSIFLGVVAVGTMALGPYGWQELTGWQKGVVFGSLTLGTGLLAVSLVRQMAPGSRLMFSPRPLPVAVGGIVLLILTALFPYEHDPDFVETGLVCLRIGVPYALFSLVACWFLSRRGAALSARLAGATGGLLAGLVGVAMLEMHCPILERTHILVWHMGVAVLGALAGLGAGSLVDAVRRRERARGVGLAEKSLGG